MMNKQRKFSAMENWKKKKKRKKMKTEKTRRKYGACGKEISRKK